jgi:Tannase-like family of unknown function (DUF6351)
VGNLGESGGRMRAIRWGRGRRRAAVLVLSLTAAGLAAGVSSPASASPAARVTVLSSAPDQVTGGDARIRVDLPPGLRDKARVLLNGDDVTKQLSENRDGALEGVLTGLEVGANTVTVAPTGHSAGTPANATLRLTNHPITGPIFSGPHQYPFVCKTARPANGLGQPLVDNHDREGYPVFAVAGNPNSEVVGWSKDCSAPTRVDYMYRTTSGDTKPLPADGSRPTNMATTTLLDGRTVDYVIRYERGTINRFVYSIAMLGRLGEDPAHLDDSLWNGRLTYSFDGGVGIGHSQGELSTGNSFQQSLGLGYAVVASTGTRTSVHYNLQVGGETALMVKEHFIEEHGVPLYTIGVGGSGGGIQQYVYGQNHPGLIDAAVPQYEYPDMVTQTIPVGDCELLEHFMDVTDKNNPKWNDPANRQALEGLHVTADPTLSAADRAKWTQLLADYKLVGARDYSAALDAKQLPLGECRQGWFGLSPLSMNPHYGSAGAGSELMSPSGVMNTVDWTHWGDLKNIYGTDAAGYGRSTWDNVGVQYGLQALKDGVLTTDEFLELNASIGGWVRPDQMKQEGYPFVGDKTPGNFDPWSSRNMNLSPDGGLTPAPRTSGDVAAMNAAYDSGMVFHGDIDIPVIDWRHYLEDQLNMHNTKQSFATRQRMLDHDGDASNQVIWFTDARPEVAFDQTAEAFTVMDQWMANRRAHPGTSAAATKPPLAVDRCFATDGTEIAHGDHVWDGVLDDRPAGACTQKFPVYESSRMVAGAPIEGDVYKCQLQSVDDAIGRGLYGSWVPTADQRARLKQIFPTGVCDYAKPDAGRPSR